MSDKVFLDTNIIVYAHTDHDLVKQAIAQSIISETSTYISTQVLQETANTFSKKFKLKWGDVEKVITETIADNFLYKNTENTILKALNIAEKYNYSLYDSLIIAAALECNCSTLYSEDMHDRHNIDNKLTIINPFK